MSRLQSIEISRSFLTTMMRLQPIEMASRSFLTIMKRLHPVERMDTLEGLWFYALEMFFTDAISLAICSSIDFLQPLIVPERRPYPILRANERRWTVFYFSLVQLSVLTMGVGMFGVVNLSWSEYPEYSFALLIGTWSYVYAFDRLLPRIDEDITSLGFLSSLVIVLATWSYF